MGRMNWEMRQEQWMGKEGSDGVVKGGKYWNLGSSKE